MSVIIGKNYGKSRLWKRRTTITLASGGEYSCVFRQAIIYVKTGSSRHRKQFAHLVKELGIKGATDENGHLIPVQSFGDYNAAFELFGTPEGMAILCSQNCVLRHENVFVGAGVPRSMGKLEPFTPANTRLSERQHDTGKLMPTNKEIGVVHGKVFRKPKANAKAFRTVKHSTKRRERQSHGAWKTTQTHEATYRKRNNYVDDYVVRYEVSCNERKFLGYVFGVSEFQAYNAASEKWNPTTHAGLCVKAID